MFTGPENLSYDTLRNRLIWISLSFQAGALNVGAYLAAHRFVTHTTGFSTLFGASIASGQWTTAFQMLTVPLFFLCGSMLSGLFIDRRIIENERPQYSLAFFVMTVFLVAVTLGGQLQVFGRFGDALEMGNDYSFLALLSLTSGLQNALVTTVFGATIRTTHLTGITTDLGLGIIRVIFHKPQSPLRSSEIKANWMRGMIITFFLMGSALSGFIFIKSQYWGFLIPVFISLGLWILSVCQSRPQRVKIR